MTPRGLTVELEPASFELSNDFSVSEAAEPSHSSGYHNRIITMPTRRRQVRNDATLPPCLDQFSRNVAGNFKRLGNRASLSYEALKFIRRGKKQPLRQLLNLYPYR
jgi:hypothetical protein